MKEKLEKENPDYYASLVSDWNNGRFLILQGMVQDTQQRPMYKSFEYVTPSRHLSVVFNLFVFMQVFNMICSRKINDEVNIFRGITTNASFIIVWTVIVVV